MTGGPSWLEMRPQDFDNSKPLTLFDWTPGDELGAGPRPDDETGTPDLFSV